MPITIPVPPGSWSCPWAARNHSASRDARTSFGVSFKS